MASDADVPGCQVSRREGAKASPAILEGGPEALFVEVASFFYPKFIHAVYENPGAAAPSTGGKKQGEANLFSPLRHT